MSTGGVMRVRRSIQDLQNDYDNGNKKALEDLMRAWRGIKALPPDDLNSFFVIGGYHGEPFRGAGWGNSQYWGGYCNHGNVLFPTWHRAYLVRLENALRSIPGCEDVCQPFWDETSADSLKSGIPSALTDEFFELDGQEIPNPLRSFVFNKNIVDNISGDNPNYSKPNGYETVRYPLAGLVGNPQEQAQTKIHNAQYPNYAENVALLDKNIVNWLNSKVVVEGVLLTNGVADQFKNCLNAPNYTVFSNTTSAAEWNDNVASGAAQVMPLEQPHNNIHLATGGFDVPGVFDASPISGANGDMGENDTAGLDPIFFFHHCFIDRVFWLWQKRHKATKTLEIIPEYPGTNSVDNQGPTPGVVPNSWLTLDSPLQPFKKPNGDVYTSRDCIDIESQLGYTYGHGSLDDIATADNQFAPDQVSTIPAGNTSKVIKVSGLNRAAIRGSFVIAVFAVIDGQRYRISVDGVLSRWNVRGCANCQTHLETKSFASLHNLKAETAERASIVVEVHTRDGILVQPQTSAGLLPQFSKALFRVEAR